MSEPGGGPHAVSRLASAPGASGLLELARQMIAIDSTTGHGTLAVAKWVAGLAQSWGLEAVILEDSWNGIPNANVLVGKIGVSFENSPLVMSSRLDTADPGEYATWTKTGANPFNASLDGGRLYGLGVADGKLDFLCKLVALRESAKSDDVNAVVLGTFGRESGNGVIRLIRQKKIRPKAALVGSPTDLQIARRAPGYAKVEVAVPLADSERKYIREQNASEGSYSQSKVFSRSSSAQAVNQGILDNPIIRMIDYLKNLPGGIAVLSIDGGTSPEVVPDFVELEVQIVDRLNDGVIQKLIRIGDLIKGLAVELKTVEDRGFSPPHSTINVGQIRMLPEEVKITGVCELVPVARAGTDREITDREIYEKWLERLRVDCAAAGGQFQILDYKPPFTTEDRGPFFDLVKGVALKLGLTGSGAPAKQCTEANVFHRLGVDTVVFGPGQWRGASSLALECVEVNQLESASHFYQRVLSQYG